MSDLRQPIQDLVIANRILAREGVLDGFGHVTIRHPDNPEHYFMSCSRGPELVRREDIVEFTLQGEPINQNGRALYAERAIHGSIYAARPDVMAVCHNHSPSVIPFGITRTPLRPVLHMAALIGPEVPLWDIRDDFGDTNLLVTTLEQGGSLARTLGDKRMALMRGHGSVVVGVSLKEVVMASVYLEVNAKLQLQALGLGAEINYLTPGEIEGCQEMLIHPNYPSLDRAWEYWRSRAGYPGI
ncbi:MAG TPA: class II aldolase/adducin family protein [Chloroflexota bacterium]|nr:class II aldolase/adducin family protein [Chloroflexota bacterium]